MKRPIGLTLLLFILSLTVISQFTIASAHTPGPMTLEYDIDTSVLTVTVTHATSDVNSHYIYEIVIEKNSVQVDIQTYTSQSSSSQVVETFTITAVDGDVLEATAKCSVSGQTSEQITVSDSTTTTTTTTSTTTPDYPIMMVVIATIIIVIGVILVVILVIKRR